MESQSAAPAQATALDSFKAVRRVFYSAADSIFGPGFFSMVEYYYLKRTGLNPIAMLFAEPRTVYDEWVKTFKGEEPVRALFEKVAGPGYSSLLRDVKRNDGIRVWDFLNKISQDG